LTDAAHMLSDFANYCIGIFSIYLSRKPAGARMTFGYNRVEVLGALLSVLIIWILATFLCVEAVNRIINPVEVDGMIMLIVAFFGLLCNIIMALILIQKEDVEEIDAPAIMNNSSNFITEMKTKNNEHVVNIKAALMNVLGDGIQSIGVIIASAIVYIWPEWTIADPICTFLFTILVLCTTIPIFKECIVILLEASPEDYDTKSILADLYTIPGVSDIHAVHVWSISAEKTVFSCHMRSPEPMKALKAASKLIKKKYGFTYPTIQCEDSTVTDTEMDVYTAPPTDEITPAPSDTT
jgi:cation diffusion facilitator family transporter